nr:hypothetical protein [Tanacetum cinerariifolium]
MNELKQVKKEKDGLDSKLTGFKYASKDLDTLLGSQRTDKNKEGLGYNAVPPPPAQVYSPPKKDMSWTGLHEFADDTITDYSRPSPSIESNTSDLQNSNSSVFEHEDHQDIHSVLEHSQKVDVNREGLDKDKFDRSKYATISESSLKRHLKQNDAKGISSLPDAEGEGSGTLTEHHHTPSPQAQQSPHHDPSSPSHPTATTESIPTEILIETPTLRQYSRRATRIAQVTSLDADEGSMQQQLQELMDLCTSLQRQQTQMATKIKDQDLEISGLKARIKILEDKDRGSVESSGDNAPIKGRSIEIGEEVGVERSTKLGSNDTEEMVNVLTYMDAVNILTSGVTAVSVPPVAEVSTVGVPTVSRLVSTVSAIFTTASVVTPYSRRPRGISAKDKGKEKVVESEEPKKKNLQEQIDAQVAREMEEEITKEDQRMNEQLIRNAEIARIHAEEELKMLIDGLDRSNELIAKHLHEY